MKLRIILLVIGLTGCGLRTITPPIIGSISLSQSTPVLTVGEEKVSLCGITVTNKKEAMAFLSEFTNQEVIVEKNDIWVKAKIVNGYNVEESITALLIIKKLATVKDADKCSESHQLMLEAASNYDGKISIEAIHEEAY